MLKTPLFKIMSLSHKNNAVNVSLKIYKRSEIFKGHFPGQPVVPGAAMLQVVKEVAEKAFDAPLRLIKADNIKFLSLVEPSTLLLQLTISYQLIDNDIKVVATLTAGEIVCMKLQGVFNKI